MDDLEELKTSVDEVTAEMAEKARELELQVEPEDVSELLQFHGGKKINLNGWPKKCFLEMEPIPGEDVKKECWNDNKEI